jgi:aspartate kinase
MKTESGLIKPTVLKFGGTSVADAAAFARVAQIIRRQQNAGPVVVVSAMSGVTNALLRCFEFALNQQVQVAMAVFDEQLAKHKTVARSFLLGPELNAFDAAVGKIKLSAQRILQQIATTSSDTAALKDQWVSYGEQLTASLVSSVLQMLMVPAVYVNACDVLVTDDEFGRANPLLPETAQRASDKLWPLIQQHKIPVLGGFIAATVDGQITTLGRGGSDYSAAILGAVLNAASIEIWTDVNGVLTADPRVVPTAKTIPSLSYQEAAELAYFGAKVLHPKTLQPAIERSIPVRVCNSQESDQAGTLIVAESKAASQPIKAIAHKLGITTLQVTSARMLGSYGFLQALFEIFARHRTVVDVVTTSEVSVSLSLDDQTSLDQLVAELKQLGAVEIERQRAIICVVGEGLRNSPGVAANIFSTIRNINVSMISLGASSVNLTFMVDEKDANEAIARLHRSCFEAEGVNGEVVIEAVAALEVGA